MRPLLGSQLAIDAADIGFSDQFLITSCEAAACLAKVAEGYWNKEKPECRKEGYSET
ncbi:MAG: hypothetical protein L0Y60_15265 [Beijerinckiaceae bacterium]|nr:hypothetical protein [Beijerinckiaceae bacterium]